MLDLGAQDRSLDSGLAQVTSVEKRSSLTRAGHEPQPLGSAKEPQ